MAILLKEITLRYSPKSKTARQVILDFYAMYNVWRQSGAGGQGGEANTRRTEFINDVFEQVATHLYNIVLEKTASEDKANNKPAGDWNRYGEVDTYRKELQRFIHSFKVKEWGDFQEAMNGILSKSLSNTLQTALQGSTDPKKGLVNLTPSIQNFVKSTFKLPDEPKPSWKNYDKPMTGEPSAIQRDLPMAGGQMDLPLKPKEKLPPLPTDLPPLPTGMTSGEPKQVGGIWANLLNQYGYTWSEGDKAYKNDARNVKIQVFTDDSAKATLPSGKTRDFNNLGELLRALHHNKNQRHNMEPTAQVVKEDYKRLYKFLYT